MLLSEAWGKMIHGKTRSKKSRDTVPLNVEPTWGYSWGLFWLNPRPLGTYWGQRIEVLEIISVVSNLSEAVLWPLFTDSRASWACQGQEQEVPALLRYREPYLRLFLRPLLTESSASWVLPRPSRRRPRKAKVSGCSQHFTFPARLECLIVSFPSYSFIMSTITINLIDICPPATVLILRLYRPIN